VLLNKSTLVFKQRAAVHSLESPHRSSERFQPSWTSSQK